MEKTEEDELSSDNVSDESSSSQCDRDSRFSSSYDQKKVRNLKIDEIINRITAFRQQSQSLGTIPDPSGPSTSTQECTSSSAPSSSRGNNSSPPGGRFIIFPEASRPNCPPEMILYQLPAGCVRTGPSSPKRAASAYLHPQGCSPEEKASTSHYNYQHLSSPVYPDSPKMLLSLKDSPRKTSSPGHPFGLGSEKCSRSHSTRDSVPIEFVKSDIIVEPDILDKKDKTGEGDKNEMPGKSVKKVRRDEPNTTGGHGEPNTIEK